MDLWSLADINKENHQRKLRKSLSISIIFALVKECYLWIFGILLI